jgi:hypothetical protein
MVQVKFTIGIFVSDIATRESTGGANTVEKRSQMMREGESEGERERERDLEAERGRETVKGGEKERSCSIIQCSHLLPGAVIVSISGSPTSESLTATTDTFTVTPSTKYVALVTLYSYIESPTVTIALVRKISSILNNKTVLAETL